MKDQIESILKSFNEDIKKVNSLDELDVVRKQYTGKNSPLNALMKNLKDATPEQRKVIGQATNEARTKIADQINELNDKYGAEALREKLSKEKVDVTLPGKKISFGTKHPLNIVMDQIAEIFTEIGFEMVNGQEVEQDLYNFQKLNLPKGHPARDMQDTFYINEDTVMRTQTTNMTARQLTELSNKLGDKHLASISFGNVYRRDDDDATHSHQFMQIDGFAVGKKISFANLKWILSYMCKRLFDDSIKIRLRPSYFPFTEPSVEVDISCFKCGGKGCALCKESGWIEVLGAGLINDQVLIANGLDPKEVSGLAFGIGVERIAMLKFGINNIRSFYENDVDFLNQFKFYGE